MRIYFFDMEGYQYGVKYATVIVVDENAKWARKRAEKKVKGTNWTVRKLKRSYKVKQGFVKVVA